MLRYFSSITAYDRIAALCDVPIGTVRSRLAAAKTQMVDLLAANREVAHDDSAAAWVGLLAPASTRSPNVVNFAEPVAQLEMGNVWLADDVEEWIREHRPELAEDTEAD